MKNRWPRPAWRAAGARAETRCAGRNHEVAGADAARISAHAIISCDAAQISPTRPIFHARRRFVEGGARCALFMPGTLREKSEPTPYPRQVPVFSRLRGRRPIACARATAERRPYLVLSLPGTMAFNCGLGQSATRSRGAFLMFTECHNTFVEPVGKYVCPHARNATCRSLTHYFHTN